MQSCIFLLLYCLHFCKSSIHLDLNSFVSSRVRNVLFSSIRIINNSALLALYGRRDKDENNLFGLLHL